MEQSAKIFRSTFVAALSREWWSLLLRGIAAVAFGVITFAWPGITLGTLVLFFGAYALVDGVLGTISAVRQRHEHENWILLLLGGLLGVGVGVLALSNPAITAIVLLFYIAIWAVATGVLEIAAAIRLRRHIEGEWLLALAGVASVAFGTMLILRPAYGALAMVWLIGAYAVVLGVSLMGLAFRVRSFSKHIEKRVTPPEAPQPA